MPAAFLIVCSLLSPFVATSSAQPTRAELAGVVRDESGALVPGATVVAYESLTGDTRTTVTSSGGDYVFTALRPGSYTLTIELSGFRRAVREGINLATGERLRVDVELTIGSVQETTTVTGEASLLRADTSSLGQIISHHTVQTIPLNGRNFVQLITLVPGVASPPGSSFPRINGGRPRVNEYLFDGISVLQPEPGQVAYMPVLDAVQEFKVETNSVSAEFGRFNGGVINLTTKSGTNELHGTAFEFFRHEDLNARNFFAPTGGKPLFRRNQFGFTVGGPLVRNRTFFFGDYQGTLQKIGRVRISTVPTLLQRQGIFTEPIGGRVPAIFDPATTRPLPEGGTTRDPFPGNTIPTDRFDPVALELVNRYPAPTSSGTANNYRRVGNEDQDQHQFDVRIDHRLSDSARLFVRASYFQDLTNPVTPLPDGSGSIASGAIGETGTRSQAVASSYTHVFSPSLLNELRVGYTRRSVGRNGVFLEGAPSAALGLPGIPTNAAFDTALPTFLIDGLQQLGSPANTFSDFETDVTHVVDVVSWLRGSHAIKFGSDTRFERLDVLQPPSPTGSFRFSTLFTDLPGRTGTGFPLASFLLGQVQNFSIDLQQQLLRPRAWVQEFFVQDDWRATSRLTVNAGLRYTLNFPSTEVDDQGAVFNLESQRLDYLGRNGYPRSGRDLAKPNLGPRVGLAYLINDKTVVRSAYGLVWVELAGITTPFINPQFPFLQTVTDRTLDNIDPAFVLADGPSVEPIPLTPDAGLGQGVFTVDRDLGGGYVQQWNLAVQRELSHNLSFEIAYVGSKITHIGIPDTNINQLTVDQLALGSALQRSVPNPFFGQIPASSSIGGPTTTQAQLLKPFPRFTTVSFYRNNVGDTNYNGVQLKLQKRFAKGLSFLVSYTHSKLLDDASSVFDAAVLTGPVANYPVADSFNRALERDLSNGDIPNVFVSEFVWDLPFGEGRRYAPGGILGSVIGGWTLAGILTLQSGVPLAVTQATNFNAFAGFGTERPNRVSDPNLPASEQTTDRFFDTDAFQIAPIFTLGTSSRNPVRGPSYRNFDLALIRRVPLPKSASLEVRIEAFNATNTPPLGAPNVVLGTAGFGSITRAGDPRVLQLAVRMLF